MIKKELFLGIAIIVASGVSIYLIRTSIILFIGDIFEAARVIFSIQTWSLFISGLPRILLLLGVFVIFLVLLIGIGFIRMAFEKRKKIDNWR